MTPKRSSTEEKPADDFASAIFAMCGRLQAIKGLYLLQRWSEQPCVRRLNAANSGCWPQCLPRIDSCVRERGVSVAQAARDLDGHKNLLRKQVKQLEADPRACQGRGLMKPD